MSSMDEVRDALREAIVAGPADARVIAAAEGKLGLSFPSDYKSFLATYGAAVGQGYEIAGLIPASEEPPFWTDVVTFTLQQRKVSRGNAAERLHCALERWRRLHFLFGYR